MFRITNISVGSNILHEWCYSGLKITCMRVNPALQTAHALVKTVCIVRLRITAQKLVLISCRVARTYVSVSDRRVSRRFLMRLTIGLTLHVRDGWAQWHVKIHRRELALGSFTVNNLTAVRTLKPSSKHKKMLWENSFKAGICLYICRLVFQRLPIAADALPRILQSSRQF